LHFSPKNRSLFSERPTPYQEAGLSDNPMNETHSAAGGIAAQESPQVNTDLLVLTEQEAARFWAKVDKSPHPNGCWIWTAKLPRHGYGTFGLHGKSKLAHRVCYRNTRGPIPPGLDVLHSCDNPPCVNPAHLWLGTNADNVRDKMTKGRHFSGDGSPSRQHPERLARGECHPSKTVPDFGLLISNGLKKFYKENPERRLDAISRRILPDDKIRELRARYSAGGVSMRRLATEYGMGYSTVNAIIARRSWSHI
jgi:hypothetical protein